MLHNRRACARRATILHTQADHCIRIVYGYDWHTHSDNIALVYDQVQDIIGEFRQKYSNKVIFTCLGGSDASIYCDICRQIQSADIAMFDISTNNPNVILEFGLAIGTGKYVFILRSKHYKPSERSLSDLNGILEYRFSRRSGKLSFDADFRQSLSKKLRAVAKKYSAIGAD